MIASAPSSGTAIWRSELWSRTFDQAFAVAVQPDGKIVAAGQASADVNLGPSVFALARYNANGSADVTSGSGGKTVLLRGRGPALSGAPFFVPGTLPNPLLRPFSGPTLIAPFLQVFSGATPIAQNNNWQDARSCSAGITCGTPTQNAATGLDPGEPNPGKAHRHRTVPSSRPSSSPWTRGPYTVLMSGAAGETGVGLVEVFENRSELGVARVAPSAPGDEGGDATRRSCRTPRG